MRRSSLAMAFVLSLLAAQPGWTASWSVGTHLGIGLIHSNHRGTGSSTILAWPANVFGYQPGLRISVSDARRAHTWSLDSGLFLLDEAGSTLSLFSSSASYEFAFHPGGQNVPFLNGGIGLYREGGAVEASTATSYGAGLGIRHVVSERHGALRAELRADHLMHDDILGRPPLTTLGLRLGFDLWL